VHSSYQLVKLSHASNYPWKGSKMDQRERPKKPPSLVSLDANAAKAMLETKADPRDPNARAILKFIGGSKAELQPKIDIELQLPSQHSDAELKVYAQALKLGDIELLRKMLIVSEEVLRAGKSAQQRGNE